MSQATITQALEQLEQLYTMRLLHQTLRERLEQAQDVAFSIQTFRRGGDDDATSRSTVMDIFRLPQQLEDMMMMRAIALSLQQVQPSTAPPPISEVDSDSLQKVTLSFDVIERLCKNEYSECPICQEEFKGMKGKVASRLPCDHVFCVKCIDQWLQSSRTCPVCRLELVGVHDLYQASPTKRKSIVCVTPPPSSPVVRPGSRPFVRSSAIRSSHVDEPASSPPAFSYRQEGVGSTALRIAHRVQQVPVAVPSPRPTPSPSDDGHEDDGEDDDESSERPANTTSAGQQALLDEIMQRRDEQRVRIVPRATPPVVVAPPPSSTSTTTPISSAARVPPRVTQSDAPRPVPPVQTRSKSNVSSSTAATPVVGRVRPAGRGVNPPASNVRASSQQQGSVGVRGLLNRRAQPNS